MILGPRIAVGLTADIHSWREGQVLKLFKEGSSKDTVEYEAYLTRSVHASGLSVPGVGEIIEIDGRYGIEYERVEGMTMLEAVIKKPWKTGVFARQLAEIQVEMHSLSIPGLPAQGEILEGKIKRTKLLSTDLRQAALDALASFPEGDRLCHGDFHPANIMLTSRGPVIIDWIDVSRGSPIMDVARSTLLMGGGPIPPEMPMRWLVRIIRKHFFQTYLKRYFQLNPADQQQLPSRVPVAAAARLDENIAIDEGRLLSIAQILLRKEQTIKPG